MNGWDIYVYILYYYISHSLKRLRKKTVTKTVAVSIFRTDYYFEMPFPTNRNQGFLKKWLIPGLGQEMYPLAPSPHLIISDCNKAMVDPTCCQKD